MRPPGTEDRRQEQANAAKASARAEALHQELTLEAKSLHVTLEELHNATSSSIASRTLVEQLQEKGTLLKTLTENIRYMYIAGALHRSTPFFRFAAWCRRGVGQSTRWYSL